MNAEPISKWSIIPLKLLKDFFASSEDKNKKLLLRKRKIIHLLTERLTFLKCVIFLMTCNLKELIATRITLLAVGYIWMLALPFPGLGRSTFMDENALQPAQVRLIVASIVSGKIYEHRSIRTGIGDTFIRLIAI